MQVLVAAPDVLEHRRPDAELPGVIGQSPELRVRRPGVAVIRELHHGLAEARHGEHVVEVGKGRPDVGERRRDEPRRDAHALEAVGRGHGGAGELIRAPHRPRRLEQELERIRRHAEARPQVLKGRLNELGVLFRILVVKVRPTRAQRADERHVREVDEQLLAARLHELPHRHHDARHRVVDVREEEPVRVDRERIRVVVDGGEAHAPVRGRLVVLSDLRPVVAIALRSAPDLDTQSRDAEIVHRELEHRVADERIERLVLSGLGGRLPAGHRLEARVLVDADQRADRGAGVGWRGAVASAGSGRGEQRHRHRRSRQTLHRDSFSMHVHSQLGVPKTTPMQE